MNPFYFESAALAFPSNDTPAFSFQDMSSPLLSARESLHSGMSSWKSSSSEKPPFRNTSSERPPLKSPSSEKPPLKSLNSQELLTRTKEIVAEERRVTLLLIEYLEEVQRRRLYAELGYSSMWSFCTEYLGLSEGAAQRRIQAMRLMHEVPEAKAKLESGSLSLSNAAKVQSFRQAAKKQGQRLDPQALITQVEALSQRECEKKLCEILPQALPRERERMVSSQEERELKIVVSRELYESLIRIKGLIAHAHPNASYAELLEVMAEITLSQLQKKKGIQRSGNFRGSSSSSSSSKQTPSPAATTPATAAAAVKQASETKREASKETASSPGDFASQNEPSQDQPSTSAERKKPLPSGKRVYLPKSFRTPAWSRSGGQCEFVSKDGKRCSSRYQLELDHAYPLALGGSNETSNLRILCRPHNLQQAQEKLERAF